MDNTLKHPVTVLVLSVVITSTVGYFGFVSDVRKHEATTNEKHSTLNLALSEVKIEVDKLSGMVHSYAALPPRVTKLEESQERMQEQLQTVLVNQGIQRSELGHIRDTSEDIKYLLTKGEKIPQ